MGVGVFLCKVHLFEPFEKQTCFLEMVLILRAKNMKGKSQYPVKGVGKPIIRGY